MSPEHKAYVVRKAGGLLRAEPLDPELPKPNERHYLRVRVKEGGVTFLIESEEDKQALEKLKSQLKAEGHESVDDALFFDQKYLVDINKLARDGFKKQDVDLR